MLDFPPFAALWRYLVAAVAITAVGVGAVPFLVPEPGTAPEASATVVDAAGDTSPWETTTTTSTAADTPDDAIDATETSADAISTDSDADDATAGGDDTPNRRRTHGQSTGGDITKPQHNDRRDTNRPKPTKHARQAATADTSTDDASDQSPSDQSPSGQSPPEPATPSRAQFTLRIGSWNVLGASHTEGRGCNRCHLPDSDARMPATVRTIARHDLDVLGLQEFQPGQQAMFRKQMPGWEIYANADNAVAWNTRAYAFMDATTFTIPYFGGNRRQMPQVRLKHLATGREIVVMSVHNPADVRGPARHWREEAVRTEAGVANALTAADVPVFLTGDMNDRAEFFCQITAISTLVASSGGTRTADACTPPPRMDVDWVLGSGPHVTFSSHLSDDSADVDFASDHPIITATATVS